MTMLWETAKITFVQRNPNPGDENLRGSLVAMPCYVIFMLLAPRSFRNQIYKREFIRSRGRPAAVVFKFFDSPTKEPS